MLSQRQDYIQSCYRNETIILVVLSQRDYYFSRAIATTGLYSVVLSQRQVFNQKVEVRMQYLFVELVLVVSFMKSMVKIILKELIEIF